MATLSETLAGTKVQGSTYPVTRYTNPYVSTFSGYNTAKDPASAAPTASSTKNLLSELSIQGASTPQSPSLQIVNTYSSDPILQRIRALGTQNSESAEAEAAAIKKQALIDAGFTDVASELGFDENTINAANQNPFSIAKNLQKQREDKIRQVDESRNAMNLFYSGTRANDLEELERNTAEATTGATRDLRALLGNADETVLGVRTAEAAKAQEAMEAAAERARQEALQQAYESQQADAQRALADAQQAWMRQQAEMMQAQAEQQAAAQEQLYNALMGQQNTQADYFNNLLAQLGVGSYNVRPTSEPALPDYWAPPAPTGPTAGYTPAETFNYAPATSPESYNTSFDPYSEDYNPAPWYVDPYHAGPDPVAEGTMTPAEYYRLFGQQYGY